MNLHLFGLCIIAFVFSVFIYLCFNGCVSSSLDAYMFYIMVFSPFILPVYEGFFKKEVVNNG